MSLKKGATVKKFNVSVRIGDRFVEKEIMLRDAEFASLKSQVLQMADVSYRYQVQVLSIEEVKNA